MTTLNRTQLVGTILCLALVAGAVITYDPKDGALAVVLGMLATLSGFVVFWETGMKKAKTPPDFDVTGPGDAF